MAQSEIPFDPRKLARCNDPSTSHEAANRSENLSAEHYKIILEVMGEGGDWTADEVSTQCDLDRHQIGRRLGELERAGIIRRTIKTRPTPSGRPAQCYEVAKRPGSK